MRVINTLYLLCFTFNISFGQINEQSPFPVDFYVSTSLNSVEMHNYGTMISDTDNPIWGPQLNEDLSGELVWGFNATDSLACADQGPIINDVTGKIALIRRGNCGFSEKVRSAQQAGAIACVIVNHYDDPSQDGTSIMGMLGTPPADDIVIPAVFISRNTGEIIRTHLDAGSSVSVTFDVKSFYDPVGSYSYQTPYSEEIEIDVFRVNYVNADPVNTVNVEVTATITNSLGDLEATLTGTSSVAPLSDSIIRIDGSYFPTVSGLYQIEYSNNQNDETITTSFEITGVNYATDSGITTSAGPSNADFATTFDFTYQAGSLIVVDDDGFQAGYASFGIANAADLVTGDTNKDQIAVILYDADQNEDGLLDFPETGGSFDDLAAVALSTYIMTGEEEADELIYVKLEDLFTGALTIDLKPNGLYYIVIAYDGTDAATGVAPRFAASEYVPYVPFPTTPIFLDELYTGWSDRTVAVRLRSNLIIDNTNNNLPILEAGVLKITPNPIQDIMNISFDFKEVVNTVNLLLRDASGQLIDTYRFDNISEDKVEINAKHLTAGTYFINLQTPNGFRTEKVIKQ